MFISTYGIKNFAPDAEDVIHFKKFQDIFRQHRTMAEDPHAATDEAVSRLFWEQMNASYPEQVKCIAEIQDLGIGDLDTFSVQSSPLIRTLWAVFAALDSHLSLTTVNSKCITTAALSGKPESLMEASPAHRALSVALLIALDHLIHRAAMKQDEFHVARCMLVVSGWHAITDNDKDADGADTGLQSSFAIAWREITFMVCGLGVQ